MTKLLEKAFEEAAKLSDDDQDALAQAVFAELASERRWDQLFAASTDVLSELAEEALAEHRAGRTKPLDPDTL
jgi:TRAP-type C4-dicarboxylate transport system substrate-binding protein